MPASVGILTEVGGKRGRTPGEERTPGPQTETGDTDLAEAHVACTTQTSFTISRIAAHAKG